MALELGTLLLLSIVGTSFFAVFEVETPGWRKALKWVVVCGSTVLLSRVVGHWALLLPAVAGGIGTTFHFVWCRRHGIDPVRATPRKRYYELRGWAWPE
jgi:hypothetical protein